MGGQARNDFRETAAVKRSTERFLTTHTGSLPRPADLIRMMFAKEEGVPIDAAALHARIRSAVAEVVEKQAKAGVDIVNDGEQSKPSYATYVKDRLAGFGGTGNTFRYQDLNDFPVLEKKVFGDPGRSRRKTPGCNAPISVADAEAAPMDADNLKAAVAKVTAEEAFMSAASPGVIALFFRNDHYPAARPISPPSPTPCATNTRPWPRPASSCRSIAPISRMGRHIQFADLSLAEFRKHGAAATSRRSTTRPPTSRPIGCACISAGAITRGRIIATCRSPTSSTSSSRRARPRDLVRGGQSAPRP